MSIHRLNLTHADLCTVSLSPLCMPDDFYSLCKSICKRMTRAISAGITLRGTNNR